jgi:hypothetical protein
VRDFPKIGGFLGEVVELLVATVDWPVYVSAKGGETYVKQTFLFEPYFTTVDFIYLMHL